MVVFGLARLTLARLTSVSMLQEAGVRGCERVDDLPNMLEKRVKGVVGHARLPNNRLQLTASSVHSAPAFDSN